MPGYRLLCTLLTLLALPAGAAAPDQGLQQRPIAALGAHQIAQLQAGAGMGLAKAAELNHYPGPRHVLDLATQLHLSPEQQTATEALFVAMQQEASALGGRLIALEQQLNQLFAEQRADEASVTPLLEAIATLQARLRWTHLHAHLRLRPLLDAAQVARYDQLRGYHAPQPPSRQPGAQPPHDGHHRAH